MKNIGLLDWDVLYSKYYRAPNYDLGVTYAYYKNDRDVNIRLISSYNKTNLEQYDKIYVFRNSKVIPHPSAKIENYYSYPIEEFGPGFMDRPLRPNELDTKFIRPNFKCYNNMILYSRDHPKSKIKWNISRLARGGKYEPVRLFEKFGNEDLRKDIPTQKYLMVFDNPLDIINDKEKWNLYEDLLNKKHKIIFTQSLDISQVNDTNILERILFDKKYASIRKELAASDLYSNVEWLINQYRDKKTKVPVPVNVYIPPNLTRSQILRPILLMSYWRAKTNNLVKFRPMVGVDYYDSDKLVLYALNYLKNSTLYMSYYEYVFNIAYIRLGVPQSLLSTGEEKYDYVCSHYGVSHLMIELEKWIEDNPDCIEYVFCGGDSNYENTRRTYFNTRRSDFIISRETN